MRATCLLIGLLLVTAGSGRAQTAASLREGVRALNAGRLDEARTLLHRAERDRPRDPQVLASLARLYATPPLADRARAVAYARRGLLRHPDHPDLLRVHLHMALADTAGARFERMETLRALSRRLLRVDPRDPDALLACGLSGYDDLAWRIGSRSMPLDAADLDRRYRHVAGCLDTLLVEAPVRRDAVRLRMQLAILMDRPREAARVADSLLETDRARADLWRWRGLAALLDDDPAGAAAFFDHAYRRLPAEVQHRWRDPAPVRPPGAAPVDADVFWRLRDPLVSTPINERWVEHLARLALADLFFGGEGGAASARGALLVLYGLPENAAEALSGYGVFVSPEEGRLLAWDYGDFRMVLQDWFVSGHFKFYSPPASAFTSRDVPDDYVLLARTLAREMPERMAMRQVKALDAVATFLFYEQDHAEVITVTTPDAAGPVSVYAIAEAGGRQGVPLATGRPVVHRLGLEPGRYRLQVEQQTPGGWAVYQDSVFVPALDGRLALSSLVPATLVEAEAVPGAFVRNGLSIVPTVDARFSAGQPLYLYVEAYGLQAGAGFEVQISAEQSERRRLLRRRPSSVAVRFPEVAAAPAEARYYVLDTTALAPGTYTVRLRVRDAAGRTVTASCSVVLDAGREP